MSQSREEKKLQELEKEWRDTVLSEIRSLSAKYEALAFNLDDRLDGIKQELNTYNMELRIHIKGVEDNRVRIANVKDKIYPLEKRATQYDTVIGMGKWLGAGVIISFIVGMVKWIKG